MDRVSTVSGSDLVKPSESRIVREYRTLVTDQVATAPCTDPIEATKPMRIYFAGSLRGGREDQLIYIDLVQQLKSYGEVFTEHIGNPLPAEGESLEDKFLHDRDLLWLKDSDCLVAEVTRPSLGVGYEIAKASEWGKPILCLYRPTAGRALSAMIAGCPKVVLHLYDEPAELHVVFTEFFAARSEYK